MSVAAIRVPLVSILIEAWADMTVSTSVIVNQAVTINAESAVFIYGAKVQRGALLFTSSSGMDVNGVLKWVPESDTSETWTSIPDTGEVWTAASDASTSWTAQGDTSESWTPISVNSETWQIAA
jgi:hypothetical protein